MTNMHLKVESSQSLMVFVQADYRKKVTVRLEKLYDDNAASLK